MLIYISVMVFDRNPMNLYISEFIILKGANIYIYMRSLLIS